MEKFLNKIPTDKVYKDLFQPGLKKAGEALSTVLDLSNSILLPIKLLNERSKLTFIQNMKRYEKKLEAITEKDLIQVPEYAGIPILDKLTYISEHNISEAFINLLAKASSEKTIQLVHPSFLSTLNDLSSDEAKILFGLKDRNRFPFIDICIIREIELIQKPDFINRKGQKTQEELLKLVDYQFQDRQKISIKTASNLTGIEFEFKINFPTNIDVYLDNLERHKIIQYDRETYSKNNLPKYEEFQSKTYKKEIDLAKEIIIEKTNNSDNKSKFELQIRKGTVEFTDYGKAFIKACISEIEENK